MTAQKLCLKTWKWISMSKFKIVSSAKFKKDFKKYQNKQKEKQAIFDAIELLENGHENIPKNMRPHILSGNYSGLWECHAMPDLLIIWEESTEEIAEIYLARVGSHSELFK